MENSVEKVENPKEQRAKTFNRTLKDQLFPIYSTEKSLFKQQTVDFSLRYFELVKFFILHYQFEFAYAIITSPPFAVRGRTGQFAVRGRTGQFAHGD